MEIFQNNVNVISHFTQLSQNYKVQR